MLVGGTRGVLVAHRYVAHLSPFCKALFVLSCKEQKGQCLCTENLLLPQPFSCAKANTRRRNPLFSQHCLLSTIYKELSVMLYLGALLYKG